MMIVLDIIAVFSTIVFAFGLLRGCSQREQAEKDALERHIQQNENPSSVWSDKF